jgi:hypothetical protein
LPANGHHDALDEFEHVAYTSGLAAGLALTLADLGDADVATTTRSGYAAVPRNRVPTDATVIDHPLVADQDIAILDVRLPAGLAPLRHAGDRPHLVGLRLAAVRIGLVRTLLDHIPVALKPLRDHLARTAVVELHTQLTGLDWQVMSSLGPDSYRPDHPARVLLAAQLVTATWVGSGLT